MSNPTVVINPLDDLGGSGGNNSTRANHTVIQDPGTEFKPVDSSAGRKVVGFAVAYSRTSNGEFWPLYLGRNVVGSEVGEDDIRLREKTVSKEHALITVRRTNAPETNEEILVFAINDSGSSGGVRVNGADLVFQNNFSLIKSGDLIDIGGYRLYILCVDTVALKLDVNPGFLSADEKDGSNAYDYDQREPASTRIFGQ